MRRSIVYIIIPHFVLWTMCPSFLGEKGLILTDSSGSLGQKNRGELEVFIRMAESYCQVF